MSELGSRWQQLLPLVGLVCLHLVASCFLAPVKPVELPSVFLEDQAAPPGLSLYQDAGGQRLQRIALLAAHTLERDETGAITMIDGGSWNHSRWHHGATVEEVLTAYPEKVYSEYRYSRELSARVAAKLKAAGFYVRIFDPPNPDRNGFIRDSLAGAAAWGADLILTLHTDGSEQQNLRGAFAIVDDRYEVGETQALATARILENITRETGIPLAKHHPLGATRVPETLALLTEKGGLLNATNVGLNRLASDLPRYDPLLFQVVLPRAVKTKLQGVPVIYLEVGTHSNLSDRTLLLNKQEELAGAISAGVTDTYLVGETGNPNAKLLTYTPAKVGETPLLTGAKRALPYLKNETLTEFLLRQNPDLEPEFITSLLTELTARAAGAPDLPVEVLVAGLIYASGNNDGNGLRPAAVLLGPLKLASLTGFSSSQSLAEAARDYRELWRAAVVARQSAPVLYPTNSTRAYTWAATRDVTLAGLAAADPDRADYYWGVAQILSQLYYFAWLK